MFGENLKTLRKQKGFSQEELATRLHVVRQTISKWEKNLSVPDADTLIRLAEILEVSVSELLGAKIENENTASDVAEQLSRINEQLAIKNRRSRRIWKIVAIILAAIILINIFIAVFFSVPNLNEGNQSNQPEITDQIQIDQETLNVIDNPTVLGDTDDDSDITVSPIDDEEKDKTEPVVDIQQLAQPIQPSQPIQPDDTHLAENRPIRIILGKTLSGDRDIVFEPNNTKMVSHPNMGIIGTMGTGKTQLARSIIAQFSKEGAHNVGGKNVGMLVFDYKGDYKDKEFIDAVGGFVYKNRLPFNPLKLIVNEDMVDMNVPAITADRISDSLAKAYGLGLKQQNNIKQAIVEAYIEVGITDDSSTWEKNPPTMNDVINLYLDTYDANDKAFALLSNLRDYNVFTNDDSNCVSILEWLDSVRVFDLTIYSDETKRVVVSLLLDLFFAEMKQLGESRKENGMRELRAIILVDEAREFMSKDFNSLRGIISQGRMFGVGMILATQYVSDFRTQKEDYSQSILSWMIHHVNSISKSEIASIFGASDKNGDRYMDFINKAKLFESVCKIGSKVEGVRDLPFFELINKDARFKLESENYESK